MPEQPTLHDAIAAAPCIHAAVYQGSFTRRDGSYSTEYEDKGCAAGGRKLRQHPECVTAAVIAWLDEQKLWDCVDRNCSGRTIATLKQRAGGES